MGNQQVDRLWSMGTQGAAKNSTGGTAAATYAKARVEMTYDDANKEMRVGIAVSR